MSTKNGEHVQYNRRPLSLLEFINVDVQVGKRTIKKADTDDYLCTFTYTYLLV